MSTVFLEGIYAFLFNSIFFFTSYIHQITSFGTISFVIADVSVSFCLVPLQLPWSRLWSPLSWMLHHQLLRMFSWLSAISPLCCYRINVLEEVLSWLHQGTQAPNMDSFVGGWSLLNSLAWLSLSNFLLPTLSKDGSREGELHSPDDVIMWPWARHSASRCLILLPHKIWVVM